MTIHPLKWPALAAILVGTAVYAVAQSVSTPVPPSSSKVNAEKCEDNTCGHWPSGSKATANEYIDRYGNPDSVGNDALTWTDQGPFAQITVRRDGVLDTFPTNHVSYVEHTVRYNVPKDRTTDIENLSSALTVDRDAGTITARSDSESLNNLLLNVSDDVASGRMDPSEGRDHIRNVWRRHMAGKSSKYTDRLLFEPASSAR